MSGRDGRDPRSRQYVVYHYGDLALTDISGRGSSQPTVDDLLPLLVRDPRPAESPALVPPLEPARFSPAPTWVALLDDGHLVLESHDGQVHRLDATDVEIIAAVTPEADLGTIAWRLGASEVETFNALRRLEPRFVHRVWTTHADVPAPIGTDLPPTRDAGGPEAAVVADPSFPTTPIGSALAPAEHGPRVPVYTIWHDNVGPSLAMGMLTAAARHHDGGALNRHFEIHRPMSADTFLEDLARVDGPAVLLCSNYIWSVDANLEVARRARAVNSDLLVIHGGPSTPAYLEDTRAFLESNREVAHIAVRGEGELVLSAVLTTLALRLPDLGIDAARLSRVPGLTFLDPASGDLVRTEDQTRIADLDQLPSPYLTGEFDDIPTEAWQQCLSIETNRGCPYGCTYCDWGSSTLSRIRKFSLERVAAEIEWVTSRPVHSLNVADANFGIISRDVEIAAFIAEGVKRTGYPRLVSYYPAKNTTKHLARIVDILIDAGAGPCGTLSLQTVDADTLDAIDRSNISLDHYRKLTAEFRRRGLPLQGDLLLGLPGQTYEAFRRDLQYHIDNEVFARCWQTRILPNAPMNDPEYRRRHGIVIDESSKRILSTNTFASGDRDRMVRLRTVDIIAERFGLLRHVMRFLQWDHGIEATLLLDRLMTTLDDHPERYPLLAWTFNNFDLYQAPGFGWQRFYDDVGAFVTDEYGVDGAALETVLLVQRALMPEAGRTFPFVQPLPHDYVGYYREATHDLYQGGHPSAPRRPLDRQAPGELVVTGDPLELCTRGQKIYGDPRDELFESDFIIGANTAFELTSPLMRLLPHVAFAAYHEYEQATRDAQPEVALMIAPMA